MSYTDEEMDSLCGVPDMSTTIEEDKAIESAMYLEDICKYAEQVRDAVAVIAIMIGAIAWKLFFLM